MDVGFPVNMNREHKQSHNGNIADCAICIKKRDDLLKRTDTIFTVVRSNPTDMVI